MSLFAAKDTIKFSLLLKKEGKEMIISCGNIQTVKLNLFTYGFDGSIVFWVDEKTSQFLLDDSQIFQLSLDLSPSFFRTEGPHSLSLKAIVKERALLREEVHSKVKQMPILMRLFSVRFADPAQVVWSQHYPTVLYTEKTIQEMIELHKTPDITLECQWEKLKEKHPIIALGLGCKENRASFYYFLIDYLMQNQGILEYDYSAHQYTITSKKKEVEAGDFPAELVDSIACHFHETKRHAIHILNGYTENPQTKKAEASPAYPSVHRDFLLNTSQTDIVDKMVKETQPQSTFLQHTLQVIFKELPSLHCFPGALISFKDRLWSDSLYYKKKIYRVLSMHLHAEAAHLEYLESNTRKEQIYHLDTKMELELKNETKISFPDFFPPTYPFFVEGKIVSEVGEKEEITFQMKKDEKTSLESCKVEIPLWDNQKVIIPFQPNFSPQFYFPFCKGERVLIAFHLFSAEIERSLEWWSLSRLTSDQQGNQIVFSPKKEKSYMLIQHVKEGESTVFKIEKQTPKEVQKIEMKEEGICIEIKDQDGSSPKCLITLDQKGGVTVTSQEKEKKIIQSLHLEKGKVELTCQDNEKKTHILQEPEKITIDSKNFVLHAEKIEINAKEEGIYHFGKKLSMESGEKMGFQAKEEILQEAKTMNITGKSNLNLTSPSSSIKGSREMKISGNQMDLEGTKIGITFSGIANIEGKMVNIKGKMTNIEGSFIKMN